MPPSTELGSDFGLQPSQSWSGTDSLNFRTCGRASQSLPSPGSLAPPKRSIRREERSTSMPTIPSRFEVTLYHGDRERKGFGSNALRFDSVQRADMPGPGSYGQSKSGIEDKLESVSWGIRGTGGFASRSTRFGARSVAQLTRPGLGVPGPGKYDAEEATKYAKDGKDFNKAKHTSAFADSDTKSRVPAAPSEPGPGHYASTAPADAKAAAAAQSAFRSTSTRGVDTKASAAVPGPGEYHDGVPTAIKSGFDTNAGAAFKAPSQPKITRVHRDLPAADARQREVLGKFADEVSHTCMGSTTAMASQVGPGHYDQNRDKIWEGHLASAVGSSAFLPGSKRTDFSREDLAWIPGPGRYNPQSLQGGMTLASAVSSFNSGTERIKDSAVSAPGPAYYEPQLPKEKRSFRMRSGARQWLG